MSPLELVSSFDIYTTAEELSSVATSASSAASMPSITTPSPLCPTPCVSLIAFDSNE